MLEPLFLPQKGLIKPKAISRYCLFKGKQNENKNITYCVFQERIVSHSLSQNHRLFFKELDHKIFWLLDICRDNVSPHPSILSPISQRRVRGCYWPVQINKITQATINIAVETPAAELASTHPLLANIDKTPTCTQTEERFRENVPRSGCYSFPSDLPEILTVLKQYQMVSGSK